MEAGTGAENGNKLAADDSEDCTAAGMRVLDNGVQQVVPDGIGVQVGACIQHWDDAMAERMMLVDGKWVWVNRKQMDAPMVRGKASLVHTEVGAVVRCGLRHIHPVEFPD